MSSTGDHTVVLAMLVVMELPLEMEMLGMVIRQVLLDKDSGHLSQDLQEVLTVAVTLLTEAELEVTRAPMVIQVFYLILSKAEPAILYLTGGGGGYGQSQGGGYGGSQNNYSSNAPAYPGPPSNQFNDRAPMGGGGGPPNFR